jgi:hypothetical protein
MSIMLSRDCYGSLLLPRAADQWVLRLPNSSGKAVALPRKNRRSAVVIEQISAGSERRQFSAPGAVGRFLLQETILDLLVDRVQPLLGAFGLLSIRLDFGLELRNTILGRPKLVR